MREETQPVEGITERQLEVARLVAEGRTNPEIAEALGITLAGAKYHVSELLGRLGLERREDIATWYRAQTGTRVGGWQRLRAGAATNLAWAGGVAAVVALAVVIAVALDGASADGRGGGAEPRAAASLVEAPDEQDATKDGVTEPAEHHPENLRTGIVPIDEVIDAIYDRDIGQLESLMRFTDMACATPAGMGGPPPCEPDEADGTQVAVFPFSTCAGEYRRPNEGLPIPDRFADEELRLFAVIPFGGAGLPDWYAEFWPLGEDYVVFSAGPDTPAVSAVVGSDGLVGVDFSCGGSAAELVALLVEDHGEPQYFVPPPARLPAGAAPADERVPIFFEYQVRPGDTLASIAARFGVGERYVRWNNLERVDEDGTLEVGVVIRIPSVEGIVHEVQPGETVAGIADRFGVTVDDIVGFRANGFQGDPSRVRVESWILVPGGRIVDDPPPAPPAPRAPGAEDGWTFPSDAREASTAFGSHSPLGVSFSLPIGSPVYAANGGQVVFVGGNPCCDYGMHVIIDHGGGYETLYAHLNDFAVENGSHVGAGQLIGYSGNTGRSEGPQLHFEIRRNGIHQDPMGFLP